MLKVQTMIGTVEVDLETAAATAGTMDRQPVHTKATLPLARHTRPKDPSAIFLSSRWQWKADEHCQPSHSCGAATRSSVAKTGSLNEIFARRCPASRSESPWLRNGTL